MMQQVSQRGAANRQYLTKSCFKPLLQLWAENMVNQVMTMYFSLTAPVLLLQMLAFLYLYVFQFWNKMLSSANYLKGRRRKVQGLKNSTYFIIFNFFF